MGVDQKSIMKKGGSEIFAFRLMNHRGMIVELLNYGCIVSKIMTPDRQGRLDPVVLGYERPEDYLGDPHYMGAVVGRYANRIAGGKIELMGTAYGLSRNEMPAHHHLHGGFSGFNKKTWVVSDAGSQGRNSVTFCYLSPHLEEGYPGNLQVRVQYTLSEDNALEIIYTATTDLPTIINLTNHSYFNLSGENQVLDHQLMINANRFTPSDASYIPLGTLAPLAGTPYDLRKPTRVSNLAERMATLNYCLNAPGSKEMAAQLYSPHSGRRLSLFTTEPGLQVYFGNFLDGMFSAFSGLCLEPQHYPDSPHHDAFPSTILRPGETYHQKTLYCFEVD